jgi:hypothetical protein
MDWCRRISPRTAPSLSLSRLICCAPRSWFEKNRAQIDARSAVLHTLAETRARPNDVLQRSVAPNWRRSRTRAAVIIGRYSRTRVGSNSSDRDGAEFAVCGEVTEVGVSVKRREPLADADRGDETVHRAADRDPRRRHRRYSAAAWR